MTEKNSNHRLNRFNQFINTEMMSLPHGMVLSVEELEALAIRAAIYSITMNSENKDKNEKINIIDLISLAEELEFQGKKSLTDLIIENPIDPSF